MSKIKEDPSDDSSPHAVDKTLDDKLSAFEERMRRRREQEAEEAAKAAKKLWGNDGGGAQGRVSLDKL